MTTQYVYRTLLIGPLLALLLDLYIATPELFEFDLWTGEDISHHKNGHHSFETNRFWPIRTDELVMEAIAHASCTIYPHCLYQLSVECRLDSQTLSDTLVKVRTRWLLHRCGCSEIIHGDNEDDRIEKHSSHSEQRKSGWSPFTLKDCCRAVVRRTLIRIHGMFFF